MHLAKMHTSILVYHATIVDQLIEPTTYNVAPTIVGSIEVVVAKDDNDNDDNWVRVFFIYIVCFFIRLDYFPSL